MKKKFEKLNKPSEEKVREATVENFQSPLEIFKSDCMNMIKTMTDTYLEIGKKR